MAVTFNTYSGLVSAVPAWMARTGDAVLAAQFDNYLANCERRIYYGYATDDMSNPLRSDPLRIPEMQTVDTAFTPGVSGTVAQPTNFVELISVYKNTGTAAPMQIVAERIIDGYAGLTTGAVQLIAVSGMNFRFWDFPAATDTFTLRSYQKLTTPSASASNLILTNYPDVYLYGCLIEASIMTQDPTSAGYYLGLYNSSVAGLNARTQRITASANPVMRVRGGMHP